MKPEALSICKKSLAKILHGADSETVDRLIDKMQQVTVKSGKSLYQQDDDSDGIYILISGRLKVSIRDELTRESNQVGIMDPGDVVGEISLFTSGKRSATLSAMRDCTLAHLSIEEFTALTEQHPDITLSIAQFVIKRLLDIQSSKKTKKIRTHTIAVIPLHSGFDVTEFSRRLQTSLLHFGPTALITTNHITRLFPDLGTDNSSTAELEFFLDNTETKNHFVILETDYQQDESLGHWTEKSISFADTILYVCDSNAEIGYAKNRVDTIIAGSDLSEKQRELVLLHESHKSTLQHTNLWLDAISVNQHNHLAWSNNHGFERLARLYSGNAVTLILGGGGARGFAHIGAIRALREARIPIDMIGGTSLGAIIAGGVAKGWDDRKMLDEYKSAFVDVNPANDYSPPIFSLIHGEKMSSGLRKHFGETHIEDCWIPFFSVACNLSTAHEHIHKKGPLWQALRASASLPGVFPPVIENSELLVDGGVVNNLPVNVISKTARGVIIAVDVSSSESFKYHQSEFPGMLQYFKNKIFSSANMHDLPTIPRVIMESTMAGSRRETESAISQADLYLDPPTGKFDMLDWNMMFDICEVGYAFSTQPINTWAQQNPDILHHEEITCSYLTESEREI